MLHWGKKLWILIVALLFLVNIVPLIDVKLAVIILAIALIVRAKPIRVAVWDHVEPVNAEHKNRGFEYWSEEECNILEDSKDSQVQFKNIMWLLRSYYGTIKIYGSRHVQYFDIEPTCIHEYFD